MGWRPADERAYAYLFGLYLGDGCITHHGKTTGLQVELDSQYPAIVEECAAAIRRMGVTHLGYYRRPHSGGIRVYSYSCIWPEAFPQCGPGKKHDRRIKLTAWQTELCDRHPEQLIRGLIHSDGCRCINIVRVDLPSGGRTTYRYSRYFFSNYSADIRNIFCRYCDQLGIHWSRSNARNISISRRKSVRKLDAFVGPKC